MRRADCYRILQLKPGASEADIKRQYKRMALKVHPDINPSPKANEEFILLAKAVEILLSPDTGTSTDRQAQREAKKNETESEKKERMEQAKMRYEYQKAKKQEEENTYFATLTSGLRWLIFKWIIRISWIFSLALILDSILPPHLEKDELVAYDTGNHNGVLHDQITRVEFKKNGIYFLENRRGNWTNSYTEVWIEKSWLLHTPMAMYTSDDYEEYVTGFDFHLGAVRWVMAFIFLIPLLTYFRQRKDLTFVFLYQLSFWGIGSMLIYLLLTQNRLVHLISLGFL
ncbi:MAG: hypothetical protein A3D31_05895 [Candidatus Fluviicola riflensis]|nr:MAG: hypothetical protein CHH17_09120 [Candidatus Fluviicola riflensis]OGS79499.1 MAG: hypothetical protein A3D31_05895 [Candidatus Fluviicola riflensis]OGS86930.1 MAG: hypothetical protein A2724_05355 [Fluviicola sp. RIFCSPHIGHO2_01_FULL_43_53]OGS89721.1 MAG: hypothetical protein A3E30_02100 [Fluviicola sp. RIFCSPHIGHO2_12_FULL_43_24]